MQFGSVRRAFSTNGAITVDCPCAESEPQQVLRILHETVFKMDPRPQCKT